MIDQIFVFSAATNPMCTNYRRSVVRELNILLLNSLLFVEMHNYNYVPG